MPTVQEVCDFLDEFAPASLAEDWDNVGLLVGDHKRTVSHLMTCLTVTPASAAEAIEKEAQLIVTHHPLPFRPLKRLTTDTTAGRLLLDLIRAGVAIYSPHTAFDSAVAGINQRLAEGLGLTEIKPLISVEGEPSDAGAGRYGRLQPGLPLSQVASRLKKFLSLQGQHIVGDPDKTVGWIGVACGSAGQFLEPARSCGCDLLITGETTFHTCLEAESTGVSLLLPGHYASERFAVAALAEEMSRRFGDVNVWASENESDPLRWI